MLMSANCTSHSCLCGYLIEIEFKIKIKYFKIYLVIYAHSLPWNQTTVRGWVAESVFSTCIPFGYSTANYGTLLFFICIETFLSSFQQYYRRILNNINGTRDIKGKHNLKLILCDAIRFHNDSKM